MYIYIYVYVYLYIYVYTYIYIYIYTNYMKIGNMNVPLQMTDTVCCSVTVCCSALQHGAVCLS